MFLTDFGSELNRRMACHDCHLKLSCATSYRFDVLKSPLNLPDELPELETIGVLTLMTFT